ncbi:MAG: PQQ-binding-like beta-propeller repeat protein [Treponema sp.]|nr:PQQ-binding-like beta-propeller repeat protein [Treponema sp.]MCL2272285.1 PQQ-binding-like beta-propeller repeat protein [Treponema sp.]
MKFLSRISAFFLLAALPIFAQSDNRQQGLLTLEPSWRQALGGEVISLPSVQAQSVVVALDGGNIKAYSADGNPLWNYTARGKISPYVTRSREGTSYFSRTNGILIAVNRAGRELWRRDIGDPLSGGVVTGWDGRLFIPAEKKMLCYTASGNLLWTRILESTFKIPPKLDSSGSVIFTLENNEVYRMDPFGNSFVWTASGAPSALLSTGDQQILVIYPNGTMEILGTTENWFMTAAGNLHSSLLPRLPASPLAAAGNGNKIAAVLSDGRIVLVSLEESKILWTAESHIKSGNQKAEMVFDDKGIYILSENGASGFSHDGKRLWFTTLQNIAAIPAFSDDGTLYTGGKDWILYTYKIEDRLMPQKNGLYGSQPDGSYGTGRPHSLHIPVYPLLDYEIDRKLEQIEAAVNAGNIGTHEPEWTTFLLLLSYNNGNIQNRISAMRILGQIGSHETVPWLSNIFRRESEPVLKAAAAAAIGAIGVDPEGIAINTFLYTIVSSNIKSEQVLIAITTSTAALCRFSGPPLSETGIRILNLLCENPQPPLVRRQAGKELASLR